MTTTYVGIHTSYGYVELNPIKHMIGLATLLICLIVYTYEAYIMDDAIMMYEPQANQNINLISDIVVLIQWF